jgi:hypothetical protein
MKTYKSPDNKVYAYEADGSQDHLIPENFVEISKEEADLILAKLQEELNKNIDPQKVKEMQIAFLQAQLDALKA